MFHKILARLPHRIKHTLKKLSYLIPNRLSIKIGYFMTFGKLPSLDHPKTYTEKIQRLKLHLKEKKYSDLVDKYTVRAYISSKIQEEDILIPLYRHGTSPEDIPFDALPGPCVIKCNHGYGYNILVHDLSNIDQTAIKKQLTNRLAQDFWKVGRELQYKGVHKKIIIEKFLVDEKTGHPRDYKVYCFSGLPRYIIVNTDRFSSHKINIFDTDRNEQAFGCIHPKSLETIEKPACLKSMLDYASKLSTGFPFMRVDFYQVNGKVYFGEITLTPDSGHGRFFPDHQKIDKMFGDLIILPTDR